MNLQLAVYTSLEISTLCDALGQSEKLSDVQRDELSIRIDRLLELSPFFTIELLPHLILFESKIINFRDAKHSQLVVIDTVFCRLLETRTPFELSLQLHGINSRHVKQSSIEDKYLTPTLSRLMDDLFDNKDRALVIEEIEQKKFTYQIKNSDDDNVLILPPLSLSACLNSLETIKKLLEDGEEVNQADSQGYTAAHFAAMTPNFKMLEYLSSRGADFTLCNKLGASVYDILKARGFKVNCRLNHHTIIDIIWSSEALLNIWYQNRAGTFTLDDPIEQMVYRQYVTIKENALVNNSGIYLRTIHSNGKPLPKHLQGQQEACASRQYKPGEFIVEYTGFTESDSLSTFTHAFAITSFDTVAIDAKKGGSFAEFINHGPPNCGIMECIHQGTPRILIYALRTIEKDETLYYNYSKNYFRDCQFYELAPQSVDAFIASTDGLKNISCKDPLRNVYNLEMVDYLIEFPDQLMVNIREKKVAKETAIRLLEEYRMRNPDVLNPEDYQALTKKFQDL